MNQPGRSGMLSESIDPQIEYRAVEPWAVIGLILGMLSPLATLGSLWWLLPPAAALVNLIALARLSSDPGRIGRIAALSGLCLSIVFGVAPAAQWVTSQLVLRNQPRPVADQFFEFLRQGQPEKAMLLRVLPDYRQSLDDDDTIWLSLRHDNEARGELERFVKNPLVRTLLELGERANVRYYRTAAIVPEGGRALVDLWYTVTYDDDDGQKKTFLVGILLERTPNNTKTDISPWRVKDYIGGFDPTAKPKE